MQNYYFSAFNSQLVKSLFLVFVFSGFIFMQNANGQDVVQGKWTLDKCIDYALHNNIQVRQAQLTSQGAGADHLQSKMNLLPTLDVNGSFSDDFGNGFNPQTFSFAQGNSQSLQLQATGNVPLFTGLQQLYNIKRAKYDFLASKYDYQNAQNNIALNVASAFLQVLLNKEIEKVSEKQRELTLSQKEILANRIKAGAAPETAIYDVEATLGRDEVSIVNAKNSIDLSLLTLAQLLQLKEVNNFDVDAPEVNADNISEIGTVTSQGVFDYAVNNQPSIKGSEARVMSADASRKMTYGGLSATLAAFGSLSTGWFSQDANTIDSTFNIPGLNESVTLPVGSQTRSFGQDMRVNFRQVVGLQLDVPLFSRGQKFIGIQKARLQLQIRQLQLEGAKNQLRQDIETAYGNAKAGAEAYLANKKSVEASQKAYEATEIRYKAGIASNFDIQQAKENVINAESQLIQAKYTYVFRMKILDFYEGKPITLN